ncbi:hypothetical protein BJ508DRAFT_332591 [Ascobolus immersus RN42]|uniref:Uncharacterized protein n=1 Tax=Ascobolus immersus RN42 TaxID=1160509 RepID=A0A3N4HSB0_ASCIM|nr:hypothetical protein BJ508DRAFT_332591 [Ascobolus immersus RN42]
MGNYYSSPGPRPSTPPPGSKSTLSSTTSDSASPNASGQNANKPIDDKAALEEETSKNNEILKAKELAESRYRQLLSETTAARKKYEELRDQCEKAQNSSVSTSGNSVDDWLLNLTKNVQKTNGGKHPKEKRQADEEPGVDQGFTCLEGGPWPECSASPNKYGFNMYTTLSMFFTGGGVSLSPNSIAKEAREAIGRELLMFISQWSTKYPESSDFYPHGSNEDYDFETMEPTTMRTREEEEAIAQWMLTGLHALREAERRVRELKTVEEWRAFGIERIRVGWEVPAFMDPEYEGWMEECWLPLKGPYLSWYEMVECDLVKFSETRIFKIIHAHYPKAAETMIEQPKLEVQGS